MIHRTWNRTARKGFNLYLMRWHDDDGAFGFPRGIGLRVFGRRFEFFSDELVERNWK